MLIPRNMMETLQIWYHLKISMKNHCIGQYNLKTLHHHQHYASQPLHAADEKQFGASHISSQFVHVTSSSGSAKNSGWFQAACQDGFMSKVGS